MLAARLYCIQITTHLKKKGKKNQNYAFKLTVHTIPLSISQFHEGHLISVQQLDINLSVNRKSLVYKISI